MSNISGPYFDSIVKEVKEWYFETKERLIKALTEDYPYGSVKLTPEQQLENFRAMSQQDWEALSAKLSLRYKGRPNEDALVQEELTSFMTQMAGLQARMGGPNGSNP